MEKNIIQISQEILRETLKGAVKTALDEIDHNGEDNNYAAIFLKYRDMKQYVIYMDMKFLIKLMNQLL